jgi:uncharacterized protein Smg (DUF494 family)
MPENTKNPSAANPLQKYFRQPKNYMRLPSRGKYYLPGTLDMPVTGELPVYAMTAKDELTFKTPDALMNGQATVDVIQSCVPNIKNAWLMPSIDMDAVLIAIRLATYGEKLDITVNVPNTTIKRDYSMDLRTVLDDLLLAQFQDEITVNDVKIRVKPINYKEFTEGAIKTFEEQRIYSVVNNDKLDDQTKINMFHESFRKLTDLTIQMVVNSVVSVEADGVAVDDPKFIAEFIAKADKNFYTSIVDHVTEQRKGYSIKPLKVISTEEDIKAGAPKEFEVPVTFDQSNFFA